MIYRKDCEYQKLLDNNPIISGWKGWREERERVYKPVLTKLRFFAKAKTSDKDVAH